MDRSKHIIVQSLAPEAAEPKVSHANYQSPKKGSVWGPRIITDVELILVICGKYHYEDEDGNNELYTKSEMCVILPGIEHTFRNVATQNKTKPVFSCIHLEPLAGKSLLHGDYELSLSPPVKSRMNEFAELVELFRLTAKYFNSENAYSNDLANAMAKTIWLLCCHNWRKGNSKTVSEVVESMTAFLRERFMDSISREDLARKFEITPQYVNRLFRRDLGVTPTEYLNKYRIEMACDYLSHRGMKVGDVAALVGFDDPFYFSRVFKKYTGQSPSSLIRHVVNGHD